MNPLNSIKKLSVVISIAVLINLNMIDMANGGWTWSTENVQDWTLPTREEGYSENSNPYCNWQEKERGTHSLTTPSDTAGSEGTVEAEVASYSRVFAAGEPGDRFNSAQASNMSYGAVTLLGRWLDSTPDDATDNPDYIKCAWDLSIEMKVTSSTYTMGNDGYESYTSSVNGSSVGINPVLGAWSTVRDPDPLQPPNPEVALVATSKGSLGSTHEPKIEHLPVDLNTLPGLTLNAPILLAAPSDDDPSKDTGFAQQSMQTYTCSGYFWTTPEQWIKGSIMAETVSGTTAYADHPFSSGYSEGGTGGGSTASATAKLTFNLSEDNDPQSSNPTTQQGGFGPFSQGGAWNQVTLSNGPQPHTVEDELEDVYGYNGGSGLGIGSGELDTVLGTDLPITTGGDADWFGPTWIGACVENGDGEETWLETTVTAPGVVTVDWYIDAKGSDNNYLMVTINGSFYDTYYDDETGDWRQMNINVTGTGEKTIRWTFLRYDNDDYVYAWLDSLVFTPAP